MGPGEEEAYVVKLGDKQLYQEMIADYEQKARDSRSGLRIRSP